MKGNSAKIIIIKDFWFPSRMANAIQTIKTVEALQKIRAIDFWVPEIKTKGMSAERLKNLYHTDKPIKFSRRQCFYKKSSIFLIQAIYSYLFKITFYGNCFLKLLKCKEKICLYSRDSEAIAIGYLVNLLKKRQVMNVYEVHEFPRHPYDKVFFRLALRCASLLIVISQDLKRDLKKRGFSSWVLPNGVDDSWLRQRPISNLDKKSLKKIYRLPEGKKIILYAGSNLPWKGTATLIKSAFLDSNQLHQYVFVGFPGQRTKNSCFFERVDRRELTNFYKIADCFVLPNTAKEKTSYFYTSPIKLFEYFAWKKPVVASNLPAIKNLVSDRQVWFLEPDNPQSLLQAINKVLSLPKEKREKRVKAAFKLVKNYTWEKRARKILKLVEHEN